MAMRTYAEMVAKLNEPRPLLDFTSDLILTCLPFEHAKPFLKEGTTAEAWAEATEGAEHTFTREAILGQAREYAEFAWGKIRGHRGISASRSVDKMSAWVWLLGEDELLAKVEQAAFRPYGAPKIAVICEALGFPMPEGETLRRMMRGESCRKGCDMGCES